MNRERKFKLWDNELKEFYPNGFSIDMDSYRWHDDNDDAHDFGNRFELIEFIDREDVEGVDMYEGHILRVPMGRLFVIEWYDRMSAFVARSIPDGFMLTFNDSYLSSALIVGHIYETPELLEGSAK